MASTERTPPGDELADLRNQLREKNQEISRLNVAVLSSSVDVDELKHHRQELRALNDFYKTQSEKFQGEAERAKSEAGAFRDDAERLREEVRRARAEAADFHETATRREEEVVRLRAKLEETESDLETVKKSCQESSTELAECRRKIRELEERLLVVPNPQQYSVSSPPPEEISSDQGVDPLDLEYLSDTQKSASRPNAPSSTSGPLGSSGSHIPEAMNVDTTNPSRSVDAVSRNRASNSKPCLPAIKSVRERSPSIELLEAPPPTTQSPMSNSRPSRKDTTAAIRSDNRLPAPHASLQARGKRKVTAEDETVATPLKKSKLAAAQPQDATVSTSRPDSGRSIHSQALQPRSQSPRSSQEVKMELELEEPWSPLTTLSPSSSPAVNRGRHILTPPPHSTPQPEGQLQPQPQLTETQSRGSHDHGPVERPTFEFKQEEALVLPPSTIARYLANAPDLLIKPPPSNLHVARTFLRLAYGGSDQQFLQYILAERNPSGVQGDSKSKARGDGKRRLVFPMPNMNPTMPVIPGHSGLLFASRHEVLENPPWGVFRRHLDGKTAMWLYLGEYESKLVGKMTKDEFSAQKESVKRRWAKLLIEQKAHECYTSMRARIALRKAEKLPPKGGEDEDTVIATEMEAIKGGRGLPVDEDDIIEAFCRGDEAIDIIRMKCVAYDHVFAKDMEERYPRYPQMLRDSREEKKAKAGFTKSTTKKASSSTSSNRPSPAKKALISTVSSPPSASLDVKPALAPSILSTPPPGPSSSSVSGQPVRRSERSVARPGRWVAYRPNEEEYEVVEEGDGDDSDDSFYVSE